MTTLSLDFKKNLESAILEHGRFACPNLECTDWITSKEFTKKDGSKYLEYHCKNAQCTYHSKQIIPIEVDNTALEIAHPNISKNIKALLVGIASILLILTFAFGEFPISLSNDTATTITNKEIVKPQPVVEKRKIILSTPVFREK